MILDVAEPPIPGTKQPPISKDLQKALNKNQANFLERLHKNNEVYIKQLEKSRTKYEQLLEQNQEYLKKQCEHYEKQYSLRIIELEKQLTGKFKHNEEILRKKLHSNEENLEQQLAMINQSCNCFRKKSKQCIAKMEKIDADYKAVIEKHSADDEAKKHTDLQIAAVRNDKNMGIDSADHQMLRKNTAALEIYEKEKCKFDLIKNNSDTKAKHSKIDADNLAKMKCKELEANAKQEKVAAYKILQEKNKRDNENFTLTQKRMSTDIERCAEDRSKVCEHEVTDFAYTIQKFELEVILQVMHFQRNYKTVRQVAVDHEMYHKSLEFCFRKIYEALNFIKAMFTSIKYFWTEVDAVINGCDLLSSKIAKDIKTIKVFNQETKPNNKPGNVIYLRNLQRKQRGHYEHEMNELYIKFSKLFDVCVIAESTFTKTCKNFELLKNYYS